MNRSRLIVLEGIAGSGKSTLTRFVGDLLAARGAPHRVVLEGDLDHPADYESIAWLTQPAFADLLGRHPLDASPIADLATAFDGGLLVPYGELRASGLVSESALDDLSARDVYELPEQTYRRLALARWQAFGKRASAEPNTWVLDCCLLQNPLTTLLVRHNCEDPVIREHLRLVIEAVSALDPIVVHLHQGDIRATLDRVISERPVEWRDSFVRYHTRQEYGKAHLLHGLEGTVQALAARQRLEEELLMDLPVVSVRIDVSSGWDDARTRLRALLG